MEEAIAAYNQRLTGVDTIYASVPVPEMRDGDTRIQIHPSVYATVSTSVFPPDSMPAYWGVRVQHRISLYPAADASVKQMRQTLDAATKAAKTHDRRTCMQMEANGEDVPGENDRAVLATVPFLDKNMSAAYLQSGFRISSMTAYQKVEKLRAVAQAKLTAAPSPISGRITMRAPGDSDLDAIVQAVTALNDFDQECMMPRPTRESEEETSRALARLVVAGGPGWSSVATHEDEDGTALLSMYPPERSQWAAEGLKLGKPSYLGLAYTPATWRGNGVMNHMIAGALEHAARQEVEDIVVQYAQHNPLSSRYWVAWGFKPVIAEWVKNVSD
ncbi:MAG: GNAT family N-acetyltransferase [Actinomycetaceae bacterium]|nr:GNAT family N-acetyltransferase [Actinomycetaceae bacterium]